MPRATKDSRIASAATGAVASGNCSAATHVRMGKGYRLQEVLLVCHGAAHNDTICIAEIKSPELQEAFLC